MATRDLHFNVKPLVALNIQAISSNTTTAGNELDLNGFESCELFFVTGAITDGDYTLLVQESSTSGSGFTNVADDDLIGTEADASYTADTDDHKVRRIGYVGSKRYVKVSIVSTSVSTGGTMGVLAVLGHPHLAATAGNS